MSETTTRGVRILVRSRYVSERSRPTDGYFFFAYTVSIANVGDVPVRLVSRHWVITDGLGRVEEVRGPGVVGEQPHLAPGQSFEYTSACPLPTDSGTMHGSYRMETDDGQSFDAAIAPFALVLPHRLN